MITQEYPLHLKSRDVIFVEGTRHVVHSAVLYNSGTRPTVTRNIVSVETTTGCSLMLPVNHTVEVHR